MRDSAKSLIPLNAAKLQIILLVSKDFTIFRSFYREYFIVHTKIRATMTITTNANAIMPHINLKLKSLRLRCIIISPGVII